MLGPMSLPFPARHNRLTTEQIRAGLADLGVEPGMHVMVHSSLSAFGWVEGGAEAVVAALMDAVGPGGTLLMPSFNHDVPFRPGGPGIYDPAVTPTGNGRIPDTFWRLPGVRRSLNPTHPYAAWGANAERYTRDHHNTLTMGEDSPLGLLARDGGFQLNLGTTHLTTTAKHVAETMLRVPCLGYRTEAYPVRLPDGSRAIHRTWGWRERDCPLTESGLLIEQEMMRRGLQRTQRIGPCPVTLFQVRDVIRTIWDLLRHGYRGIPPCSRCPIRPRRTRATVPSDWRDDPAALEAARAEILAGTEGGMEPV